MIMVIDQYNNTFYINPEYITRIEPANTPYYRIYTTDGGSVHTKTDIKVILDLINKSRGTK